MERPGDGVSDFCAFLKNNCGNWLLPDFLDKREIGMFSTQCVFSSFTHKKKVVFWRISGSLVKSFFETFDRDKASKRFAVRGGEVFSFLFSFMNVELQ